MRRLRILLLVFVFLFVQSISIGILNKSTATVHAEDNGLALTPPMGWNSWNKFGGNIDEWKIMSMADAMVANGMKDAGYEYINIDDNWMATERDANGNLQADSTRFPDGIKHVSDYVHSKGLKLGIYSSNGTRTCMGLPASQGHEEEDAKKFAEWGVDYLKYDFCYNVRNIPSAYAPDIDKIDILADGINPISYEAESATLSGNASVSDGSTCSGGKKVGYIGNNDGYITFDNVSVNNAGEYTMKVYYLSGESSRNLYVSVNGGTGVSYALPSSGGWSIVGTYDIKIALNQGTNSIRLFNSDDNTALNVQTSAQQYGTMSQALKATGRPIVFSICEWGSWQPWTWGPQVGNLWRTTGDISNNWSSMVDIVDKNSKLDQYAGPGHWNDPDMLEVGNNGMTDTEYRAHFSLWSIMAAPLIAGNDISNMSDETKAILLNKDVIAVDQDSLGVQGKKIRDDGDHEIFVKPLSNGDAAVVLFNRGTSSAAMSVTAQELGLKDSGAYLVRDLWQHLDKGSTGTISADVPSHGAAMFRVSPSTVDKVPASLDVSFSFNNYAEAGNSVKVTTTFSNTGIKPVSSATANLQVPDGWTASSLSSSSFDNIAIGQSVNVDWNVTVPANATAGSCNLAATISYMDGTNERQQQGSAQITVVPTAPKDTTYLSDIDWFYSSNGWGPVEKDMSVGESSANDGKKITLNGVSYEKGLGAHAPSEIYYNIGGNYAEFTSVVGLDDEVGSNGSVTFEVWGDGQKLWDSGLLKGNSDPVNVKASIAGVKILKLVITNGGDNKDYDHADWADAMIKTALNEVSLSADKTAIRPGGTTEISVIGKLKSGSTADLSKAQIMYTCDNENVATVDDSGKVTAVGEGKANIKVSVTLDGITCENSIEIVVDGTAPTITVNGVNDGEVFKLNDKTPVIVTWTASDELSGIESAAGDIESGTALDVAKVGAHTLTFTVLDKAGNKATKTITYYVQYDYSGLSTPFNNNGSSSFNLGSTIPVKFQLKDAKGIFITNAIAKLYIAKVTDNVVGEESEAVSTAVSDGNNFRYDSTSNQYIFNLNTKGLTAGTYQIRIDVGDGTSNIVKMELR
ncbi:MAG: hypothetical protein K0R54_1641 [Clostridiaceae bacterium]|jgi:hypothetical protein|nr:hypothetical protein [Clostridiaceae bacterium]